MATAPVLPRSVDFTLQGLTGQLRASLAARSDAPTEAELLGLCDVLYAASLLKEEGRAVRARVVIAPPTAFLAGEGPPAGTHAIRFSVPHELTGNEIKRMSPAASFFHTAIAIWPDGNRRFQIWGILNTGPRWLNLVAGGRKPAGGGLPHPVVHVRDPGWLLFYRGYELMAEWRGREIHGPRIDVFQSSLLNHRFSELRKQLVCEMVDDCLPAGLEVETYVELSHLIALQFIKRVINLVRTGGHGGTVVILPEGKGGLDAVAKWIDCKYSSVPDVSGMRFRRLLQEIVRRVGQLSAAGAGVEEAWQVFRQSNDPELDQLEEAFFELARLYSDLMQVDGALVLDQRLSLIGFGGEIRVDRNVLQVGHALDLEGTQRVRWNVRSDGTRHRSVYRLCSVEPGVIGFVISQDSQVRMIANVDEEVVFWSHTMI